MSIANEGCSSPLCPVVAQFPDQLQKPDVDFIEGLSPSIAIRGRELVLYLSCEGEKQQSLLR